MSDGSIGAVVRALSDALSALQEMVHLMNERQMAHEASNREMFRLFKDAVFPQEATREEGPPPHLIN
jgi:hypothetical protein